MSDLPIRVGDEATFSKTVSESDVYLFAGITGDLSPNHVNEEWMRQSRYGRRIVHGALLVGYMSNCSTALCARVNSPGETPVSLGYDRIRFIAPVFIGDTITVTYRITETDAAKREAKADVRVTARGELCAVATHILRWVPEPSAGIDARVSTQSSCHCERSEAISKPRIGDCFGQMPPSQ